MGGGEVGIGRGGGCKRGQQLSGLWLNTGHMVGLCATAGTKWLRGLSESEDFLSISGFCSFMINELMTVDLLDRLKEGQDINLTL